MGQEGTGTITRRPRTAFSATERSVIATAAAIVFTRVFAFSLTTLGFTEYARTLVPAGTSASHAAVLAGIAFGAYGITMALAQLGTGILSDKLGRRPVLLAGTALFVLGAAASAMANSIWPLIIAQLVQGLGGVSSSAMAAVGETVPAERRTTAMALVGIPAGIGVFLGFVVGPTLVGTAASPGILEFQSLFWLTALLGAAAGLPVLLRPLPAPLPGLAEPRRSLTMPILALALSGFAANYALRVVMFDFQSEVLQPLTTFVFALVLAAAFVMMAIASRAIDRSGNAWLAIVVSLVILGAAAPLFRLLDGFAWVVVAGIAFYGSHAVLAAVLPSQVSRLAGRSGGTGHGIQLVVSYLGSAAGGFAAGWFAPTLVDAFVILGGLCLAGAGLVAAGLRDSAMRPSSERAA